MLITYIYKTKLGKQSVDEMFFSDTHFFVIFWKKNVLHGEILAVSYLTSSTTPSPLYPKQQWEDMLTTMAGVQVIDRSKMFF